MRITLLRSLKLCCGASLVAGSLVFAGQPADRGGRPGKLPADLADRIASAADSSDLIDVIIQGEPGTAPVLRSRLLKRGGVIGRDLGLVDGMAATLTAADIADLVLDPAVRRISPNRLVLSAMDVAAQAAGASWSRGPGAGSAGPTGRGVGVAVIDSGIYPHEDLPAGVVRASVDFIDPTRQGSDLAADPYGHGTHVAGIIAGRSVASPVEPGGYLGGMAPGAHLVSLRVLDHKGMGRTSDVIAALQWCMEHRREFALGVVNLSLGQPIDEPAGTDPLAQAVERAWRAGLVVVASAGNAGLTGTGYGTIASPANDPLVIAVGALDDRNTAGRGDDEVAPFSSRGPARLDMTVKPDIVAPGVRIVSLRVPHSTLDRTLPEARISANRLGSSPALEARYFQLSGSSMAAALVSGAVALMLQADPTLSPDDVKARLMRHADHGGGADIFTRGAGMIDVASAIAEASSDLAPERAASSASPVVAVEPLTASGVLISDTGAAWGDPDLWSLEDLYGDPALWGEEVIQSIAFFEDPCLTGNGIAWQHAKAAGIVWQNAKAAGIVWQNAVAEGIVWQNMTSEAITSQGIAWQHSAGDGSCPF
ncbi:MAG TPA: S8 family peptidase [Candidatus Polarisedimenticolia bacterium]|jgi:serine protease AprX